MQNCQIDFYASLFTRNSRRKSVKEWDLVHRLRVRRFLHYSISFAIAFNERRCYMGTMCWMLHSFLWCSRHIFTKQNYSSLVQIDSQIFRRCSRCFFSFFFFHFSRLWGLCGLERWSCLYEAHLKPIIFINAFWFNWIVVQFYYVGCSIAHRSNECFVFRLLNYL